MVSQDLSDANSVGLAVRESSLESSKQSSRAWNGSTDKLEFPKNAFPVLATHMTLAGEVGKDGVEFLFTMIRELESLAECVNDPAKKDLSGLPSPVSFQKFLQGECLETFIRTNARSGD